MGVSAKIIAMLSLDGCGIHKIAVSLHRKPDLDGVKGFCTKIRRPNVRTLLAVLANASPSIHLIGKCCGLHDSWL